MNNDNFYEMIENTEKAYKEVHKTLFYIFVISVIICGYFVVRSYLYSKNEVQQTVALLVFSLLLITIVCSYHFYNNKNTLHYKYNNTERNAIDTFISRMNSYGITGKEYPFIIKHYEDLLQRDCAEDRNFFKDYCTVALIPIVIEFLKNDVDKNGGLLILCFVPAFIFILLYLYYMAFVYSKKCMYKEIIYRLRLEMLIKEYNQKQVQNQNGGNIETRRGTKRG